MWPGDTGYTGGRCYFLLLVDDLSRYMWVVVLGSKGEAADAIRRAQASAEAECGRKLRVLMVLSATRPIGIVPLMIKRTDTSLGSLRVLTRTRP